PRRHPRGTWTHGHGDGTVVACLLPRDGNVVRIHLAHGVVRAGIWFLPVSEQSYNHGGGPAGAQRRAGRDAQRRAPAGADTRRGRRGDRVPCLPGRRLQHRAVRGCGTGTDRLAGESGAPQTRSRLKGWMMNQITNSTPGAAAPITPPFTLATATLKVRMAEDAWNSRDPERVAL